MLIVTFWEFPHSGGALIRNTFRRCTIVPLKKISLPVIISDGGGLPESLLDNKTFSRLKWEGRQKIERENMGD